MIFIHEPLISPGDSVFGVQAYSRIIADSDDELYEFGELLGLQPDWIQTESRLHFKVSGTKLQLALSYEKTQYLTFKEFEDYFTRENPIVD